MKAKSEKYDFQKLAAQKSLIYCLLQMLLQCIKKFNDFVKILKHHIG